jgi:hypothetical protein
MQRVCPLLREALKVALEGPFTVAALAERLGVTLGEAEALVGALLAHGYLREVEPRLCEACPLRASCPAPRAAGVKLYEVTERGRALLRAPRSTP